MAAGGEFKSEIIDIFILYFRKNWVFGTFNFLKFLWKEYQLQFISNKLDLNLQR